MRKFFLLIIAILPSLLYGQGLVKVALETSERPFYPSCGAPELIKFIDNKIPGYSQENTNLSRQIGEVIKNGMSPKSGDDVLLIPVVFHIVYHDSAFILPDSVIENQINVLNENYRRQNADTINMRSEYQNIVGDSKIEFMLATVDPDGHSTTGITRTKSPIQYFGGVLPYNSSQTPEITAWVNDSLIYNYFRLTQDSLGGIDAWDESRYLNVWIGDLRILEPLINNFKEFVFFALTTPPHNHPNWGQIGLPFNNYSQGVIIDYRTIGANNPFSIEAPYQSFNGKVTRGKILVHEIGHYLGLRHIWGDNPSCSVDDFIYDTPNATSDSQWGCNLNKNTCTDSINGVDLKDMIENFMDYSDNDCQNSFTLGQIAAMRTTLKDYRPDLSIVLTASVEEPPTINAKIYPNPTSDLFTISINSEELTTIALIDVYGKKISPSVSFINLCSFNLSDYPKGIYFCKIKNRFGTLTKQVVKY